MSTGAGKPFIADSLRNLLHLVIDDVLENPLYWTKTVQNVISSLETAEVSLTSFGPTNVIKSLRRALESAGVKVTETGEAAPTVPRNMRGGSGHIAIVGMSGRFPGGADLEEFWKEVLEKGRDMHSKVIFRSRALVSLADRISNRYPKIGLMWRPTSTRQEQPKIH